MNQATQKIIDGLRNKQATAAAYVGLTGTPCGKCGMRFMDVDSVLPGPTGFFASMYYHEQCHPVVGNKANPALALRDLILEQDAGDMI